MSVRWCITEDWKNPAKGEEWHEAKDYNDARWALLDRIRELFPRLPSCIAYWNNPMEWGTVIDFGSHVLFGLIAKEDGE